MIDDLDENGVAPWSEAKITINTAGGDRIVTGLVHPLVPGLAITSRWFGLFDVTHIASGKTIAKGYARMHSACLVAAEFALCADWRQDAEGISDELGKTKDEPAGHPNAKSVTGGVESPMTKGSIVEMLRGSIPKLDEFPWEGPDNPNAYCYGVLKVLAQAKSGSSDGSQ